MYMYMILPIYRDNHRKAGALLKNLLFNMLTFYYAFNIDTVALAVSPFDYRKGTCGYICVLAYYSGHLLNFTRKQCNIVVLQDPFLSLYVYIYFF